MSGMLVVRLLAKLWKTFSDSQLTSRDLKCREKLAVLCVCEWSYLSWAEVKTVRATDALHTEWIDLHRGDYFAGVVEYLRSLLDVEATLCSEADKKACTKRFLEAVALEEAFFDNAYT